MFTISFKKVMAVALPTTVALGVRSSSFSRLPEWSGSVWPTTMYFTSSRLHTSLRFCRYSSKNFSFTVSNRATPSAPRTA